MILVPVMFPFLDQKELLNNFTVGKQMTDIKLIVLQSDAWNHLSVCK